MGTLAWGSEPKVGSPPSPRMWPEGRTSEDAKFYGCLYPPQVPPRTRDPIGAPPSHCPQESSLKPFCPH